jgi:predicted CopG family antitoxin
MDATERIQVSSEIKAALEAEQLPDESYSDTIERLIEDRIERRRKAIREGAGLWEGTDAKAEAEEIRDAMNDELGPNS